MKPFRDFLFISSFLLFGIFFNISGSFAFRDFFNISGSFAFRDFFNISRFFIYFEIFKIFLCVALLGFHKKLKKISKKIGVFPIKRYFCISQRRKIVHPSDIDLSFACGHDCRFEELARLAVGW